MKLKHAKMLREYHLKCAYRYTFPVAWEERLKQIDNLIREIEKHAADTAEPEREQAESQNSRKESQS